MKVSDYIVEYLIEQKITDVFGYPGGMVTHLMDSFRKYQNQIVAHINYHEQASSFAACGYAQASGKVGVAYATSGPGATNLITGICDAYFDSIPCVFITGQVNTFESKGHSLIRQKGFQETDIVSMVKNITKYSVYVEDSKKIKFYLDKAFYEATHSRKGPVLLDIPMNIFKSEIDISSLEGFLKKDDDSINNQMNQLIKEIDDSLKTSKKPCLLVGNGIKSTNNQNELREIINKLKIPVVTSMISFDVLADSSYGYGFIGAYGTRSANFIVSKCDLLITMGSRLDVRQVGANRINFANDAKIIRIDIDSEELTNIIRKNEINFKIDINTALRCFTKIRRTNDYQNWLSICNIIKERLQGFDDELPNFLIKRFSLFVPENTIITTDVGQNQVWVAQSFQIKNSQKVLFSGGHGAMGFSLPAAIGAYYGSNKKNIVCFNGDGGFQMNIQELQFIARENLPIKIVIINNYSLGMIRHFQEMYFDKQYFQTTGDFGYTVPDFSAIANAYGIRYKTFDNPEQIHSFPFFKDDLPIIIELKINRDTYVYPKLEFGKPNQDQQPLLDRKIYNELMNL